ncbi:unannotated protein [freshwater metagenome]|uniref:Unannotated protein n=1 Tax=freshwater metagenome TaxID=449393 RepID=A0A6J6TII9_9ZZZZ|nr:hypothetical protein [Actinomycetota bacterium]
MRLGALVGVCLVGVSPVVLSACSGEQEPRIALPTLSIAPTATAGTPPAGPGPGGEVETSGSGVPRAVLEDVVDRVRAAGSVRLAVGNLNPPPTQFLVQDYAAPDGDLELSVEVVEGEPVFTLRRVDGEPFLAVDDEGFRPVPEPSSSDEALAARTLRTDPASELETLVGGAIAIETAPDLVDEVDDAAAAYRLRVVIPDLPSPGLDAFASVPWVGLPERLPVTLWVGADGLPLRLEARYADPLNGIEGTGTARLDYSAWGEPVELEAP